MSNRIDSKGAFIGTIKEAVAAKSKNGFMQAVLRVLADKKWVDSADDLKFYMEQGVITEAVPQWADWSAFDEDALGYLVLFKDVEFREPLLNYEQLKIATGWAGDDFATIADMVGKQILFRMDEDTYNGKTSLKMNWVDSKDASPTPELRPLNAVEVAAASALLKKALGAKTKPTVAAAKPPAKAPALAKPAAPKAPKATAKTPPKANAQPVSECDQQTAWDEVMAKKGDNSDDDVTGAWVAVVTETVEETGRAEDAFTNADWGKVRSKVMKDLAL